MTILGQQYTVRSDASPERIARVAGFVNDRLNEVAAQAPTADTHQITVLTLLNVVEAYLDLADRREEAGGSERLERLLRRVEAACEAE
ncbi:cell division protein ZapA [Geothermobacter ehrlichii]|uniref:Cell division protein ZapA n=1 Tax=Geothermobacter ehrlichii TaxID=213224 RepID=A0A5D3WIM7_9BACT|nr:cell division protein ZapA [Geothermobacter ehrlichii]